jgi:hypothetical protein
MLKKLIAKLSSIRAKQDELADMLYEGVLPERFSEIAMLQAAHTRTEDLLRIIDAILTRPDPTEMTVQDFHYRDIVRVTNAEDYGWKAAMLGTVEQDHETYKGQRKVAIADQYIWVAPEDLQLVARAEARLDK